MRIKWGNIVVLFILILVIVLMAKSHLVEVFSQIIEDLRYRQDAPLYILTALGMICITLVGIFALISNRKH
jgi:hypothetical protein